MTSQTPERGLRSVEEAVSIYNGNFRLGKSIYENTVIALKEDRHTIAAVLVGEIEKLYQNESPMEDGVPVETYGYEETHNQALKQAIAIINKTLGEGKEI